MNYLIVNQLGTPDDSSPEAVGRYLTEFLMDKNVIGLPRPFRDVLVKVGIVPRRKFASAKKYKEIWTVGQGSPLAIHTNAQVRSLQSVLGADWKVLLGMRYGNPSIESALNQIPNDAPIVFLPMYPHFAQATVGSAIEKIQGLVTAKIHVIPPFFERPWYIEAQADVIARSLNFEDHLLLSYHGIPLSQESQSPISYRKQCFQTTELLKEKLGRKNETITTGFQSRVGMAKWIEPSTENQVKTLAKQGVKHLKVACPSFVADCLETLEEIGIGLRQDFLSQGGETFELIPCLNESPAFTQGLAAEVRQILERER